MYSCSLFSGKIIEIYEGHPPQGLSEARRGKEIAENLLQIRRGGVPPGAAAPNVIIKENR